MARKAVAVITPEESLARIATEVHAEFGKGLDASFAIGHLLNEARSLIPGDAEFGQWLAQQEFAFSQSTANRLQRGADNESSVREFIAQSARTGRDLGVPEAIKLMNQKPKEDPSVKRVQDLFKDEPEPTNGWPAFREAAIAIDLQTLETDELVEFASLVQTLVKAYGVERKRRS